MRANIQAVSLKIQTLKSQSAMAQAMKGVTKAMGNMNKQMKMPEIQKIMMEFEKQSEIMDMKGEMMEDAVDMMANTEVMVMVMVDTVIIPDMVMETKQVSVVKEGMTGVIMVDTFLESETGMVELT